MNLIYVAGRYRAPTREGVNLNIQAATMVGLMAAEKGWYPVIPHTNTMHFEHLADKHDEFYLDGTLELMRRCDAVVMVPGWKKSSGAIGEVNEAKRLNMDIFFVADDLPVVKAWLASRTLGIRSDTKP